MQILDLELPLPASSILYLALTFTLCPLPLLYHLGTISSLCTLSACSIYSFTYHLFLLLTFQMLQKFNQAFDFFSLTFTYL